MQQPAVLEAAGSTATWGGDDAPPGLESRPHGVINGCNYPRGFAYPCRLAGKAISRTIGCVYLRTVVRSLSTPEPDAIRQPRGGLFWWPWFVLVLILYLPWRRIDRMIAGKASVAPFIGSARINAHRSTSRGRRIAPIGRSARSCLYRLAGCGTAPRQAAPPGVRLSGRGRARRQAAVS